MKLYPFLECADSIVEVLKQKGTTVYQQFNCAKCGRKQTMDTPNTLFTHGKCEECGHISDLQHDGCNYMVIEQGLSPD